MTENIYNKSKSNCKEKGCNKKSSRRGYCLVHYNYERFNRKTCSVTGCNNKPKYKGGICTKHQVEKTNKGLLCKSNGCKKIPITSGYCHSHYRSYRNKNKTCKILRCDEIASRTGLCNIHYKRMRKYGTTNKRPYEYPESDPIMVIETIMNIKGFITTYEDAVDFQYRDKNRSFNKMSLIDKNCEICKHNGIIRQAEVRDHCLPHMCGGITNSENLLLMQRM